MGVATWRILPLVFAFLGLVSVLPEQDAPRAAGVFFRHLANIVTSGIAAITAFLVVNALRLGLGVFNPVVWIAPGALGTVGIRHVDGALSAEVHAAREARLSSDRRAAPRQRLLERLSAFITPRFRSFFLV
jgi:hypothetical protein